MGSGEGKNHEHSPKTRTNLKAALQGDRVHGSALSAHGEQLWDSQVCPTEGDCEDCLHGREESSGPLCLGNSYIEFPAQYQ